MCLSFALMSMEYHDVLPNISLSRMSIYAVCIKFGLEEEHIRKKYENINNSNLGGMALASFCQSRAVLLKRLYTMPVIISRKRPLQLQLIALQESNVSYLIQRLTSLRSIREYERLILSDNSVIKESSVCCLAGCFNKFVRNLTV